MHHSNPFDPPTDLETDIGPPDPRQQEIQWADDDEYERFIRDREEHFANPDILFLLRRLDEERAQSMVETLRGLLRHALPKCILGISDCDGSHYPDDALCCRCRVALGV